MVSKTLEDKRINIPFHFHPYKFDEGKHAVEKADESGKSRRYLKGITSGMKSDGHGERMTSRCIKGMQDQAATGTILLYEGQHGVTFTADLGILVESEISPTGEWVTTYRLYDQYDGFEPGSSTLERADKLWRQVNGLSPYVDEKTGEPKPLQKGFSVEGYIPPGGITAMTEDGKRTIDKVLLDGVVVTPRPAYGDSVITAIAKALDELTPQRRITVSENIRGKFINKIEDENRKQSYYQQRFKFDDALNENIEDIMAIGEEVKDKLNILFDTYKEMMINLLVSHSGVFVRLKDQPDLPDDYGSVDVAKMERMRVFKNIQSLLKGYIDAKSSSVRKSKTKKEGSKNDRNRTKRFKPRRKTSA